MFICKTVKTSTLHWPNCRTLRGVEKNIGETHCDFGLGKEFFSVTPSAQALEEKIDKFNFSKIKNCTLPKTLNRIKR